jgi:hypothetical protein
MTLDEIETALDSYQLEVRWNNGRWHAVRRNGATKHWKKPCTPTGRWRIPCKTGFRDCFAIAPLWHDGDLTPDSERLRVRPVPVP